ncbi:MAG: hypothetical protein IGS23_03095 [Rivularia sp. T60_A2020_040]|nr:hypothetical protein [Rivularia sp. T60_A2020_040]
MIKINWKKDYNGEFVCPKCEKGVMRPRGKGNGKKDLNVQTVTVASIVAEISIKHTLTQRQNLIGFMVNI